MPFKLNDYHLEKPVKAFLFLMKDLGYTQREAQRMIARGRLFIEGEAMKDPSAIIEGDFQVVQFVPVTQGLEPIFVHKDFAVFDKPSGVLVHPSSMLTPYSLIDEAKHHFGSQANITHRIDQETSGLIIISRNRDAEVLIKTSFENRKIQKEYLAFVKGEIKEPFLIDAPIHRHHNREAVVKVMMEIHPDGKPSQTFIDPLKYYSEYDMTLVSAKPRTGRQHQIRVHLFHVKHPIIGDPLYNVPLEVASDFLDKKLSEAERLRYSGAPRLLLHAQRLEFEFDSNRYELVSRVDFEKEALNLIDKSM